MTSLAQPVLSKSNGLNPLGPRARPQSPEEVRFQVISDYLHDLRTPLVALRGYSRMVLEERAGSLNSAQKEYLGIVMENTNRVVSVLNELAQLASLEPLAFRLVDARELVQAVIARWRPLLSSKSIQLRAIFPAESYFLRGDQQRLGEAFEELLSKVTGSAGPGEEILIELSRRKGKVQIRLSGSSAGSGEDLRDGPASSSPCDRTGGLSTAESVIRLHGGHIEVRNDADDRPGFGILLPACSNKEFPEGESDQ